jgi:hypothetical protein
LIGNASPLAGDARQKFVWRADSTTLNKYTREYRIKATAGQVVTKNGIPAGQYTQPVTEWIMPEGNVPGAELPALNFAEFTHLTKGVGPFVDGDATVFGPLNPYPGSAQPPAAICTIDPTVGAPVADAGPDQTVLPGAQVTLTGKNTKTTLANGNLIFTWSQTAPTPLLTGANAISDPTLPVTTFITPNTAGVFTYQLKICIKDQATGVAAVPNVCNTDTVVITTKAGVKDIVIVDTFSWESRQSGVLFVTCHSNVVNGRATSMTLVANSLPAPGSVAMLPVASTPGAFSVQVKGVKLPGAVTCTSNLGGTASRTTTTQ